MKTTKVLLACCLLSATFIVKAQVYEDPTTGNVGIGTSTIDNTQGWHKVLQLNGTQHAKFLVKENTSGVKVGMYAHAGYNGKIGTESNTDLTFTAGYWNDVMTLTTAGKVGVGTMSPAENLSVIASSNVTNQIGFGIAGEERAALYRADASGLLLYSSILPGANSSIHLLTGGSGSDERMTILGNGFVGIGTFSPTEKLAVNGNIRAREIKVENANWPDYVFTKDYPLPTLQQTENHIKEKGHLPGIPSAAEVKANGIDLGEMNAKLLQKIEELTLHLIEKDKEIKSIKTDYQELREMIVDAKSKNQ